MNWHDFNNKRILGTVPVRADGSAYFAVPAERFVYFQLLDENRMELRRMRSFISFQPGETRACVGCHESRTVAPIPSRVSLAVQREPSPLILPPWGDRPVSFLRDIQPVFGRLAQNLMLAAATRGVGSCPVTLHHAEVAREVLGLSEGQSCKYAVALGYPDPAAEEASRAKRRAAGTSGRKAASDVIKREG